MNVILKMMDKDNIGFELITIPEPVKIMVTTGSNNSSIKRQLQELQPSPKAFDRPVLVVKNMLDVIYRIYELHGNAYLMNEQGDTISKVDFKDLTKHLPVPKLSGLDLLNEHVRGATELVEGFKGPELRVDLPSDANSDNVKEYLDYAFKEYQGRVKRQVDTNFAEVSYNNRILRWVVNTGAKEVDIKVFTAKELADLNAIFARPEWKEKFYQEITEGKEHIHKYETVESVINTLERNNYLYNLYIECIGGTLRSDVVFTPMSTKTSEGDMEPTCHLDGAVYRLSGMTMGFVMLNNVYYTDPLSVKLLEETDPQYEVQKKILEMSTVFFHAFPRERVDTHVNFGWINYAAEDLFPKEPEAPIPVPVKTNKLDPKNIPLK